MLFPVHINDGINEVPKDDIYYTVGKDGLYIYKKIGIMESLVPVKNISFLNPVTPMVRLHVSKIPASMAAKVVGIFRAAYEKYKSEAAVILFYHEETKKHRFVVPKQEVSAASVSYTRNNPFSDWTMLGTIHSHASMNAFHSGTDVNDEANFDGLHITFGDMDEKDKFSVAASIVSNGTRVTVNPADYIEGLYLVEEKAQPIYTSRYYKYVDGKFVEVTETRAGTPTVSTRQYFSLKTSKKNYSFEPEIIKNIEEKKYTYQTAYDWRNPSHGGYGDWRKHFNRWAIDDYSDYYGASRHTAEWEGYGVSPSGYPETPLVSEKNKPDDKSLPVPLKHMPVDAIIHAREKGLTIIDEDDLEADINMCQDCIYRDEKLEWALENADLIDNATDEEIMKLEDHHLSRDEVEEAMLRDQSPSQINDEIVKMFAQQRAKCGAPPPVITRQPVKAFDKTGKLIPFIATKVRGRL